jgi:LPS-assembly protein
LRDRGIEDRLQWAAARRPAVEERRAQHRDAGERQQWRLERDAFVVGEPEVTAGVVRRILDEDERPEARADAEPAEIEVGKHIGIHEHERLGTEQWQRVDDPAAGFERDIAFVAVSNRETKALAITEALADLSAAEREIDDDVAYACVPEPHEMVLDQRTAADVDQRFRQTLGQRTHSFATTGGEQHRFHERDRAATARPRQVAEDAADTTRKPLKGYMICAIVAAFARPDFVLPIKLLRSVIAWLCWFAIGPAFAQQLCLPVVEPPPVEAPSTPAGRLPLEITAGQIDLAGQGSARFSEQVEIRFGDTLLSAERATYDRNGEQLDIAGRVTLRNPQVSVFGEDARVNAATEEIYFGRAGFEMPSRPARGAGEEIFIRADNTVSLSSVFFTTCPEEQMAWELIAKDLTLNSDAGFGTAHGVKLEFKGVPILYTPYFTFPIDSRRKSGFLTPHFAERDRTGLDLSIPYYLNLAPNYDLTLEPRYLSKRGVQVNSDFRYLSPQSAGSVRLEYLPDDDEVDADRDYLNLRHETEIGDRWELLAAIEEVSDDNYFEDLGEGLSVTSQTHLNRYVDLSYFAPTWSLLTRFQNYQTIDTLIADEERPYEQTPQLLFQGAWLGRRLAFDSTAELTNFERNVGTTGWRFDSTQEASVRFGRAGLYLTPAIAVRQTNYWIDDPLPGAAADDTLTRSLPIGSLDMGLRLERPAGTESRWLQTLEPRLLYVSIPFEDQSQLPVFDTILPDFNLVQLFRKYQFVGPDRISDTDQLSFGVTTRLFDATTGRERLSATLGQTRYLSTQQVSLPGAPPNVNASDYVAELEVGLSNDWDLDVGYQWSSETDSTARAETRFEYRPQDDRLFGFGYRYRRGSLEQGDLSLVWPVGDRWRLIGRYSYSLLEEEPLEQFVGWEYEACCWRLRVVGRRYVSRRTGETDSSISLQLELKGLTQRASSPAELLDRGILGYRQIEDMSLQ